MSVPTVQLTGDALYGVHIDGSSDYHRRVVAALPRTVKLGRVAPPAGRRANLVQLEDYFNAAAYVPPATTNYREKAAASIARMFVNDRKGCCVISSMAHSLGLWSANDSDSGGILLPSDNEIEQTYNRWKAGPGDSGCIITDALDAWMREGFPVQGKRVALDGYAAVDWTNDKLLKAAIAAGGGVKIGIDLPGQWTESDTWDVVNSRSVGGHDVYLTDYDSDFFYASSWGRIYRMTPRAVLSTRYLGEAYFLKAPSWYGPDKLSPSGFDAAGLEAALAAFKQGRLPDGPTPIVPPAPPAPPAPKVLTGTATLSGRVPLLGSMTLTGPVVLQEGNVPAISFAHAVPMPADFALPPWLVPLLLKYGEVIVPIVYRDLLAGKNWQQILQDVLAAIVAVNPKAAVAAIDPAQVNVIGLTMHLLQLVNHVRSGNYAAVVADLLAIASDLGIDLKGLN